MNAYLAVAACWVVGIFCGTYLIANNMPWWGIAVVFMALCAGTCKNE